MAQYSYNGWLASKTPSSFGGLQMLRVGTETFPPGVRNGDVHTVLSYVATQLDKRVEPVAFPGGHPADDWGYNYRTNRNANNLSCHASGTAFDFNATRHPNGKRGTFSAAQVAEIRRILAEVNNVVKWGGDFKGTADEMHFEIHGTNAQVSAVARRIDALENPTQDQVDASNIQLVSNEVSLPPQPITDLIREGDQGEKVRAWQGELWRLGFGVGPHDAIFGPATFNMTRLFQLAAGVHVDSIVGPQTLAIARVIPNYPKPDGPGLPLCQHDGPEETVRAFQQVLANRGWTIGVDGDYGPQTSRVITAFQKEKGLTPDGIGGPQVWTAANVRPVS